MNGVEILSSETIYNTILPEYCLGIGLGLAFIFIIAAIFCFVDERVVLGLICVGLTICSVVVCGLTDTYSKTDISHIEYKVIINDTVSMNEFLDKYEIIDQEGKIYTVKERD